MCVSSGGNANNGRYGDFGDSGISPGILVIPAILDIAGIFAGENGHYGDFGDLSRISRRGQKVASRPKFGVTFRLRRTTQTFRRQNGLQILGRGGGASGR